MKFAEVRSDLLSNTTVLLFIDDEFIDTFDSGSIDISIKSAEDYLDEHYEVTKYQAFIDDEHITNKYMLEDKSVELPYLTQEELKRFKIIFSEIIDAMNAINVEINKDTINKNSKAYKSYLIEKMNTVNTDIGCLNSILNNKNE